MTRLLGLLALACASLPVTMVSACGTPSSSAPSDAGTTLTVSAASSLTEAFTALGEQFQVREPGVTVRFNFAGSGTLAEQVNAGAPVDVFAAASASTMATVVSAGNAADPVTFATNTLAIAVPPGNPGGVSSLRDLARPGIRVAVCAPAVPCGSAASELLSRNDVGVTPVSQEPDVKSVLAKVTADEVDAGIVYVTDVRATGDRAVGVAIPPLDNVTTEYQIAVTATASAPDVARRFVDLVTSPTGAAALEAAGFGPP